MTQSEDSKPVNRVQVLDATRGFALAGILIINAMSILAVKGSTPAFTISIPAPDRFLQDVILFLIESKFFTMFSLLFGIGFAIHIQSAERQGSSFLPRISRRMLGLLVFGLLHILLLWDGDILVIYAITGSLLILFRKVSDKALKRWVVGLLAVPGVLVLIGFAYTLLTRLTTNGAASMAKSDESLAASFADTSATEKLLANTFVQGITDRIHTYLDLSPLLLSRIPTVLAMFLIGLYLGRTNYFRELEKHVEELRRVRKYGLGIGFTLMALIVASTKFLPATSALIAIIEDQYLAGPILSLGFAATFVLAYLKNPKLKIFKIFGTVGQMALTNYIMQSLVLTFIAYGWGLGYALRLNGFQVLAIVLVLYAWQVLLSTFWLKHFRYGPLEWVWRCVTYWKVMPFLKTSPASTNS